MKVLDLLRKGNNPMLTKKKKIFSRKISVYLKEKHKKILNKTTLSLEDGLNTVTEATTYQDQVVVIHVDYIHDSCLQ